jgi:hypothetical protein
MRRLAWLGFALLVACSSSDDEGAVAGENDITSKPPSADDPAAADEPPAPLPAGCPLGVNSVPVSLGKASVAGEHALTIQASSTSKTSWAETGNEALVLEVQKGGARVGHIVLHQGQDAFAYGMHVGALAAGDELTVRVSPLSAKSATKSACITNVTLTADLGVMAEGITHAPIVKWPTEKSFDDLPVLLGWSRSGKSYQLTYTNENGGTCALCGGGARGLRSEFARWGRGLDMEGVWAYGGAGRFERCDGTIPAAEGVPRMHEQHPVLYYGDGHNRVFESRGGYGRTCGTGADKTPNGDLRGWNAQNPGDDESKDDPYTIVLRPLPVDMDSVGANKYAGRREGIVDTFAPWLYRITDAELHREGKIDDKQTFDMSRYLFVDVRAMDVGGSGDATCGPVSMFPQFTHVSGGFVVRAVAKDGTVSSAPQMTADYFGPKDGSVGVKRIAIPLEPGVTAKDITKIVFDAYDGDGIYFLALGDAFVPRASGTNGAVLDYVNKGERLVNVYVDDDSSSCTAGKNTKDGVAYPCVGSSTMIQVGQ